MFRHLVRERILSSNKEVCFRCKFPCLLHKIDQINFKALFQHLLMLSELQLVEHFVGPVLNKLIGTSGTVNELKIRKMHNRIKQPGGVVPFELLLARFESKAPQFLLFS